MCVFGCQWVSHDEANSYMEIHVAIFTVYMCDHAGESGQPPNCIKSCLQKFNNSHCHYHEPTCSDLDWSSSFDSSLVGIMMDILCLSFLSGDSTQ